MLLWRPLGWFSHLKRPWLRGAHQHRVIKIATSDLQISTNGTLHSAANLGDASVTATVNSQPFLPYDLGNVASYDTGKITLTGGNAAYVGIGPQLTLNADYDALLNKSYNGPTGTLSFNSLTIGVDYEIQLWANDSRAIGSLWGRTTTVTDSGAGGVTATLEQNNSVNLPGNNFGEYVIGSFTADAASKVIDLGGSAGWVLSAAQIRTIAAVPEPSSFGFGLLVLGLGMVRARSRKRLQ